MQSIVPADLTVFLAIARQGGFRGAAQTLRVTPSALSHALRTLETRVGVRLFNRTTRSVALTDAGARLYERVQPAFQDIEAAIDDLAAFRGAPMGALRLNAAPAVAELVLAPLIAGFLEVNPAVSLELITQGALVDVVSEGFDAGVRFGETLAADMIAVPIGPRIRFAAVASPAFLTRWPRPVIPGDLVGVPCVRFRFDGGGEYHWEFERAGEALAIAVDGPFATNAQALMVRAAVDGIGVAFVMEGLAAEPLAEGRLVRVLEDWCPYFPGLYLYYPSRRHTPAALRAFIDYARAHPDQT